MTVPMKPQRMHEINTAITPARAAMVLQHQWGSNRSGRRAGKSVRGRGRGAGKGGHLDVRGVHDVHDGLHAAAVPLPHAAEPRLRQALPPHTIRGNDDAAAAAAGELNGSLPDQELAQVLTSLKLPLWTFMSSSCMYIGAKRCTTEKARRLCDLNF